MENKNIVLIALHGGMVGYFASEAEIPADWKLATRPELDITDVMASLCCDKTQALAVMNDHWRPAIGVSRTYVTRR